jgi:hypothetical protein
MPKTTILGSQVRDSEIKNLQLGQDTESLSKITNSLIVSDITNKKITITGDLSITGAGYGKLTATSITRGSEEINSTYLRIDGTNVATGDLKFTIPASGSSKGVTWTHATSGDFANVFVENYGGTQDTRLVIGVGNNANDYIAFRHKNDDASVTGDILEIRNDRIVASKRISTTELGLLDRKARIEFSSVTNGAKIGIFTTPNIASPTTVESVTFKEDGNVGINITSPAEKLDVNGNIRVTGNMWFRDATRYIGTQTNHNLHIRTNNADRISILNGGNVGIGIASPLSNLHNPGKTILGNGFSATSANNVNILNLICGNSASGSTNGITFWENASTPYGMSIGYDGAGSGAANKICIYDSSSSEIFTFQNGGNFGIGVGAPSEKLDVNGNAKISGKLFLVAGNSSRSSLNIPHGAAPSSPVNGDMWSTTSALYFRLNGTTRTMAHTASWSTVSQAEAEAGTATSQRFWTAQRVRQAINSVVTQGVKPSDSPTFKHLSLSDGANSVTIPAGATSATWTHNFGSTNYAVMLSPDTAARHVFWSDKANNTIKINIDYPHNESIIVDVILIGS